MSDRKLKIPPNNIEAEQALLGSLMMKSDGLHEINDIVSSAVFYPEKHKNIWEAILELQSKGEPTDLVSVANKLNEQGRLESIGGRVYLADILEKVPSASNIRHYATIVFKKATMRRLIIAADYIEGLGYKESDELEETLDKAEKSLFDIKNFSNTKSFVELKDTLAEAWERLDKLHNSQDGLRGVPTGFKDLDNKLSGLQKSDLIILAARPSMGKTSLALDIARLAATKHNVPVCLFSLEMSSQQLVDRMLAAESMVDAWKLRTGKGLHVDRDFDLIREGMDRLAKAPIFIDDTPGNNILRMRSIARKLKSEKGIGLIVVDYLQLMTPVDSRNSDNMVQQVTEISRSLKTLARELDVPVLALSQLNRAVESRGGKPRLSDLRDSGSIEQDADVVMFIHREKDETGEQAKSREAEILIEKHRNGPTGTVKLIFNSDKVTFQPIEKGNFGDFMEPETKSASPF